VRVVLLGPQRRPTLDSVVRSLGLPGPFATVTAGWREREPDVGELVSLLSAGRPQAAAVNLGLYRRGLDVVERDPEWAAAERETRRTLAGLQEVYLLRLDYALRAVYAVQRFSGRGRADAGFAADAGIGQEAFEEAVAGVRALDEAHRRRVNGVRGEFYARFPPHERPVIVGHRDEVAAVLRDSSALVVAGGHVGVLADVLHLFNVAAFVGSTVIAWSAGAMALADQIVLFNDRAPQGPGQPEVYGSGLSLLRDVVLLPHARARLLLDDAPRMAVLARRFAPARCVPLEAGNRIDVADGAWPDGVRVIEAA
jgi:hypothetical protein